ncbi:MAG: AAA family ATPase [Clostridia bacterium]|nr:AAA family ATPase [Clostridia bacterium]
MKVISFNSYKGGACRTTTCYNTLPYLAKALGATSDEPIIVYDIDLDSMGLTSIFHAKKRTGKERLVYSAKHLFVDDENGINQKVRDGLDSIKANQEYFSHYEKVGEQLGLEDDGSVLFLGADKNASTVSDDDYLKFAESSPAQMLIRKMKEMSPQPKAIIFDCASGVQMTTLVALQLSDYGVMCMRPTFQFRVGTADYLLRKIPFEINKRKSRQKREIILLPTAVAQMEVPEDDPNRDNALKMLNTLRKEAFDSINEDIIEEYKNESKDGGLGYVLNTEMVEDRDDPVKGIPEIERFKWQECLLYKMDCITEQEKILKRRYEKIAGLLAR